MWRLSSHLFGKNGRHQRIHADPFAFRACHRFGVQTFRQSLHCKAPEFLDSEFT